MPRFAHTVQVDAPPSTVFGILDDVGRTPEWLTRCTRLDKLSDGPNTVGTELRYQYRNGSRTGEMSGRITAREPDEHLAMVYTDPIMDVSVDFVVAPGPVADSTTLTHTIDVHTKGAGRIFWPIVRATLPRQTAQAMSRLKTVAENDSD